MKRRALINYCSGILIALWILCIFSNRTLLDYVTGHLHILQLQTSLQQIREHDLSEEELADAVSKMWLDFPMNTYSPEISYQSPSDWSVRLVPDESKAFRTDMSWPARILFFEFQKMDYPDIEIEKSSNPQSKARLR